MRLFSGRETLVTLVPEFLLAVPADPFDGQPFRYAAAKRLIYSVGNNGLDDGGSGGSSWNPHVGLDMIMPIDPVPLPPLTIIPLDRCW